MIKGARQNDLPGAVSTVPPPHDYAKRLSRNTRIHVNIVVGIYQFGQMHKAVDTLPTIALLAQTRGFFNAQSILFRPLDV